MRQRQDEVKIVRTHMDLSPLVPVVLVMVAGLIALVGIAIAGNETALSIVIVIVTAALISLGVALGNSVRKGERKRQDAEEELKLKMWRINAQENLELLEQQARAQAQLGLGTQRVVRAALSAAPHEESEDDDSDIIVPGDIFNDL